MLLGRDGEIATTRAALRRGRAVVIVGEAGAGKTALLRAAGAPLGPTFEGGALASLQWHPYLVLQRAVRRELHGTARDVARELAGDIGRSVLLLDDLQWADPDSLAAVRELAGQVALIASVRDGAEHADAAVAAVPNATIVTLLGLPEGAAEALVANANPALGAAERRQILARAGGNPLVLKELAETGAIDTDVTDAIGARLAGMAPETIDALALLALVGRPLARAAIGPGTDELLASRLATVRGDHVVLGHGLLGEHALARLDPAARAALHERAARLVRSPGEAARHYAAAGERELACTRAVEAAAHARTVEERAGHLEVAAACADGALRDELAVDAASAMLDAGQAATARALATNIETPEAVLVRVRADARLGAATTARGAAEAALDDAPPSVEAALRLELGALSLWPFWDAEPARLHVETALKLGLDVPEELRARAVLAGCAIAGAGTWEESARAVALAAPGPHRVVAAIVLALGRLLVGRGDEAAAAARTPLDGGDGPASAAIRRLLEHSVAWHVGGLCEPLVADGAALLDDPQLAGARVVAAAHVALACADAGETRAALAAAAQSESWARSEAEAAVAAWARAESELSAGRLRRGATAAARACESAPSSLPVASLAAVTRAWAAVQADMTPRPCDASGFLPAAAAELGAVSAFARADWAAAESGFDDAATRWLGVQRRGALRCSWAAGEVARRAGARDRAVPRLTAVEQEAELLGHRPLVARARDSLRHAGVRRPPQPRRRGPGELSAREREVLEQVAAGHTTREIAATLGVAASTVDTQIETAMRKLGARTRRHAAAMIAEHARD